MTITNIIKYIDLNKLNTEDQNIIKEIIDINYEKIHREIHNITNLVVHVKLYEKGGKAKKYSIHMRMESPSLKFTSNLSGWDLKKTLHRTINNLIKEIQHKIRG